MSDQQKKSKLNEELKNDPGQIASTNESPIGQTTGDEVKADITSEVVKSNIRLDQVVRRLSQEYKGIPLGVKSYHDSSIAMEEKIKELQDEIKELKQNLKPAGKGRNGEEKLHKKKKISSAEKYYIRNQIGDKTAQISDIKKNKKFLDTALKLMANVGSESIMLKMLKDRVKDDLYYAKYGKNIRPAIDKFLSGKFSPEEKEKLIGLKREASILTDSEDAVKKFNLKLGRFLLNVNQALYIRCTGNPEKRLEYFLYLRNKLKNWNPGGLEIKGDQNTQPK